MKCNAFTILAAFLLTSCSGTSLVSTKELPTQTHAPSQVTEASTEYMQQYALSVQKTVCRYLVLPADVPNTSTAIIEVTILPHGTVKRSTIIQSSGYASYDKAALSAIMRAQPFPIIKNNETPRQAQTLILTIKKIL